MPVEALRQNLSLSRIYDSPLTARVSGESSVDGMGVSNMICMPEVFQVTRQRPASKSQRI